MIYYVFFGIPEMNRKGVNEYMNGELPLHNDHYLLRLYTFNN